MSAAELTLIDRLLREQKGLQTPAAVAADYYDSGSDQDFSSLIPLSRPQQGEQYAFQVELDKCTGCKACVTACHSLNGLDDDESWRDTGTYASEGDGPGILQTITSACHHCASPECMHGCPVGAYDKDSETGIVRHLDDQCIGCSYCILKCPHDVPKYSEKRGIVRKCDMCHDRLAEGEAPACVQACPTAAIKIVNIPSEPVKISEPVFTEHNDFTRPLTRYIGRPLNQPILRQSRKELKPEHAHAPLIFMLVLSQVGAGFLLLPPFLEDAFAITVLGTVLIFAGLGIGALHLGQPLKVWRFFLGLRTSWLSREFAVFGALTALAPTLLADQRGFLPKIPYLSPALPYATAAVALAAVFTSVMLYVDTRRKLWSLPRTAFRFYATVFAATAIATQSLPGSVVAATILLAKYFVEQRFLRFAKGEAWSPDQHSARLITGPLRKWLTRRKLTLFTTIALTFISPPLALASLIATELCERTLFFTGVTAPKMT